MLPPVHYSGSLSELEDHAFLPFKSPLPSKNLSTEVLLVLVNSVFNTLLEKNLISSLSINGLSMHKTDAVVYSWTTGLCAKVGDKQFCSVLKGALRRALETLESNETDAG